MKKSNIKQIEKYVKKNMGGTVAHDFKHIDRVRNWALKIAKAENYQDLEIVETAALMHDIGRDKAVKDNSDHGKVGAKMTRKYLTKNNFFNKKAIENICHAIEYHNKNRGGEGRLLDILRDADMMELFGAVGIMRAWTFHAHKTEYDTKNIKSETWQMGAKDFDKRFDCGVGVGKYIMDNLNFHISCYDNLATKTGKKIAKPMVKYIKDYILELEKEIKH